MKRFLYAFAAALTALILAYAFLNEKRPGGIEGPEAEELADIILASVGAQAWDTLGIVAWSFMNSHHYIWDKQSHVAKVAWDDYSVVLNLNTLQGKASKSSVLLDGSKAHKAIEKAYAHWCNDSFWLNAPAKLRDSGARRKVVKLKDGSKALLVEYTSGGVTPGDAYLWIVDESGRPLAFKMWVSIIPLGGVKATWEDWEYLKGAWIAKRHSIGPAKVEISNLRAGMSPSEFDLPDDFFTKWANP